MYRLYGRGKYYTINEDGYFLVGGGFSENWKVYSIVKYWNSKVLKSWESIKKELDNDKIVSGYLYDVDHGTTRFWGGNWGGKLPKVEIYKIKQ